MPKKILIANRGEIALRVIRAARELGYSSVAIHSDPDAHSLPVREADEAFRLPGSEVRDTYLDLERILDVAREAKVWGIHPGYGFLSENAAFAEACEREGFRFIGPKGEVMRRLGSKVAAKQLAKEAKVPVLPGYEGEIPEEEELKKLAKKIGYPLLIKAAAGGGGKGMRVVHDPGELPHALESARREAQAFFKDPTVFFEKYLSHPRHIEVQILGDEKGNLVHLFERECSIQRRHQKMIEESPSPSIDAKLRAQICEAALTLAKQAAYTSAGTVEFIVDQENRFYFLEVNTRLQVEHPITEWVTGIDLVKAQLTIAEGHALPFSQKEILQRGHAIECRLYAEDPENNFLPAEGVIGVLREPIRPGVRIDSALEEGRPIHSLYDPMLAKLTVHAWSRKEAIAKMEALLADYVLLGTRHNLDFLRYTLGSEPFQKGRYDTHSAVELQEKFLQERKGLQGLPSEALVAALFCGKGVGAEPRASGPSGETGSQGLYEILGGFKNV